MKTREYGNPEHHEGNEPSGFLHFHIDRARQRRKTRGFSLVEMLIVITVIGIITAIAVPAIGDTSAAAHLAKNKRNAQNLASIFAAAQTAGVDFFAAGDLDQTIENVITGGTVSAGAFAGEFFGVPGLGEDEIAAAAPYLELTGGMLVYRSDG